jgi:hypothetical protein
MNEAETRAEHIDLALEAAGWVWLKEYANGFRSSGADASTTPHLTALKTLEESQTHFH